MKISIQVFPAKNGDSFLLRYGNDFHRNILIDAGYTHTFHHSIQRELEGLAAQKESLDYLIVTHIDSDHILGSIALLKSNFTENFINIKNIWHNAFRHLHNLNDLPETMDHRSIGLLNRVISRGFKKSEADHNNGEISARQGMTLAAHIMKGNYLWNAEFNGRAVCIENTRRIELDENSSIFLLSPDFTKLEALKKYWTGKLVEYGIDYSQSAKDLYDDAFEMLMSWEKKSGLPTEGPKSSKLETVETLLQEKDICDTTPTNGSSIAFIITIQEKKLLFLADAHPDIILKSLNEFQSAGLILFDVIKVAHHGSSANTSKALLEKIDAKVYIFSTNGYKDGHPDKSTIARIISRPTGFRRELIFNYVTDNSRFFDNLEWKEKYNYSITYLTEEPYTLRLNGENF